MTKKLKIILFLLFAVCLVGAGVWYFSNTQEGNENLTQTTQYLKLLNSHSYPQAGDEWVVSFETTGLADLTITPTDSDTIDDLNFVSLTCNGKEKTENGSLQILEGDTVFYSDWQCDGEAGVIHLVNIARKHTLKFSFGNLAAFAYNNPDSVSDSFNDESKISATSSAVVAGGQVYLADCQATGTACSADEECCSGHCADGYCCDTACTGSTCQRCDGYSNNGTGTCGYVSSSSEDPDNECGTTVCYSTGNCSGTDYACAIYSGGEKGSCSDCYYCSDADADCDLVPDGSDPNDDCSAYTCINYIYGWSGSSCKRYSGATEDNGDCNGSGSCYGVGASCTGIGLTSASCGSSECKMACVANAYYTNYDAVYEVCYIMGQCSQCKACNGSGTCAGVSECSDCYDCEGSCSWCDGSGNCVSCDWQYSYTSNNKIGSGFADRTCKPSIEGSIDFSDYTNPGCSEPLFDTVEDYPGESAYGYECDCQ